MKRAVEQALMGIAAGQSPFGATIVKDGKLIAAGHNEVWRRTDPTAHAEVVAIQRAAAVLRTIDLAGCEMYTTCEPCPMCAAAIHWSKIARVYFGAGIADAQEAGFTELTLPAQELYRRGESAVQIVGGVLRAECTALFSAWLGRPDHRVY
ncbi:MAG: nucleoside deaminase [Planctomycetes bacterium]|nr:nucleoside deaminase [Planctomycetota bacterium]